VKFVTFLLRQHRHSLPSIFNINDPRISILPEGGEYVNQRLRNIMSCPNLAETPYWFTWQWRRQRENGQCDMGLGYDILSTDDLF
jgi:hypothetical protein